jgi:cysteine-rich repeat protein
MKTKFIFSTIISFLLIICYTPAEAALRAPTITEADALSSSQITITWNDSNKGRIKFQIERSLSQSGGFVLIKTTGKSVKTFTDSGLTPDTSYYYRVRTYKSSKRRGTEYSPFSNIAGAVTQSAPVCGDGIVDTGEQCDDGNTNNSDDCRNDCTVPVCGDGIVDTGEQCDDGNIVSGDDCEDDCTVTVIEPPTSEYVIAEFHCNSEREVGQETTLKVKIENNGPTDPGAALSLSGTQGDTTILITTEEGQTVFAEAAGGDKEYTFKYYPDSIGAITWQASVDGNEALQCTTNVIEDGDNPPPTGNIIAMHDRSSPQYDKHCTECHGDVLTRKSLNTSIPTAHLSMLPYTPGEWGDDKQCRWCHRSVDLAQGSAGNLRRNVDAVLCSLCHGPFGPAKQFYVTGLPPDNPDGEFLYDLVCAACHGELADSEVRDESAEEIQGEIDDDEGGMGPLNVLSPQEIQAIAVALGGTPAVCTDSDGDGYYDEGGFCGPQDCSVNNPAVHPDAVENCNDGVDNDCDGYIDVYDPECGGIPPVDGAALYEQYCASCHRPLENSEMRGKSAEIIQETINQNKGGMRSLNFLTFEEIQAIADALAE